MAARNWCIPCALDKREMVQIGVNEEGDPAFGQVMAEPSNPTPRRNRLSTSTRQRLRWMRDL